MAFKTLMSRDAPLIHRTQAIYEEMSFTDSH